MPFKVNKSIQQTTFTSNGRKFFLCFQIKCEYTAFFHIQQYHIKNTTLLYMQNKYKCILIPKITQKAKSLVNTFTFINESITNNSTPYCNISSAYRQTNKQLLIVVEMNMHF